MQGRWRGLCGTLLLLAALAVTPAPAAAVGNGAIDVRTASWRGSGFTVFEGSSEQLFFGTLAIHMIDGPLAGRTYEGSEYHLGEDYQSLSAGPETVADGVVSYPSSYAVSDGDAQVLRVDELIRMRQGERAARFTYTVTNTSDRAVAFRPSVMGVTGGTAALTATPGRGLTVIDDRDGSGARLDLRDAGRRGDGCDGLQPRRRRRDLP